MICCSLPKSNDIIAHFVTCRCLPLNLHIILQVLVPIANGSEEMEVIMLVDILRRARVDVVVASVEKSMQIVASQNTKLVADKSIAAAAAESVYDLIILPVR